jgi:3-oxoacyl-[acyl-carrier-protein] synthase-3
LPPETVTNAQLCSRLDTSEEWIESRSGIRERRVVTGDIATVELAVEAGARALASAGYDAVDAVVMATTSPDRTCPAGAPEVASRLGLGRIAAFDITSACSGFVYGLATAAGLIAAGVADRVLMIGADAFTTFVSQENRNTAPLFGDGGGAVVLRRGEAGELGALGPFDLGTDGEKADLLSIFAGGSRQRAAVPRDELAEDDWYLSMAGRAVYQQAIARLSGSANAVLDLAGWTRDDVDWFVGHQANIRILEAVGRRLGLAPERVPSNIDRAGNTVTASIPLLLAETAAKGHLQPGDRVLLSAFGAGLSWGSTVLRWPEIEAEYPQ